MLEGAWRQAVVMDFYIGNTFLPRFERSPFSGKSAGEEDRKGIALLLFTNACIQRPKAIACSGPCRSFLGSAPE